MALRKKDGRKLEHGVLEWIRKEAVKRVVRGGESPEVVIAGYGLDRTNIYKWLRMYKAGGWKALKSTKAKGPKKKITKKEIKQLKRWLVKDPRQLHFSFGLWTLEMVQLLIKRKFKKDLHLTTVDRLLDRIGYTHQKPLFRAWQQDPVRVQAWLDNEYPAIKKEAKKERRKIFFEDEAGFRSTDTKGKTWAARGKRPIVRTTGARFGFNAISAVSAKGEFRFSIYEENFDGDVFIDFLKRLLESVHGKITLIVDGHPVHKRKKVREFIEGTKGKLKLYFLPPYSPERNPDEFIWQAAKGITKRTIVTGPEQFKLQVGSILHALQKRKDRIVSIFSNPDVVYAKLN
jgi:transposase